MFTTTNHKVIAVATRTQHTDRGRALRSLLARPEWTTVLVVVGMIAFVTALTVLSPVAPHALADTSTPAPVAQQETSTPATVGTVPAQDDEHAVCMTDAECAQWDAQGYAMPDGAYTADSVLSCTPGYALLDTLNPDMGREGVVCAPVAAFLPKTEV